MIGASKLTTEDVAQIKQLFETTTLTDAEIADEYGVSRIHINLIRRGKRWDTDNHSFLMKEQMEKTKNFYIVRFMDLETGQIITTANIELQHVMKMKNQIVEMFENQTGGITIFLEVFVD